MPGNFNPVDTEAYRNYVQGLAALSNEELEYFNHIDNVSPEELMQQMQVFINRRHELLAHFIADLSAEVTGILLTDETMGAQLAEILPIPDRIPVRHDRLGYYVSKEDLFNNG